MFLETKYMLYNSEGENLLYDKKQHKLQTFEGTFMIFKFNRWTHFKVLYYKEIQVICKNFGFKYGTIVQPEYVKQFEKYENSFGIHFYSMICKENETDLDNCKIIQRNKM